MISILEAVKTGIIKTYKNELDKAIPIVKSNVSNKMRNMGMKLIDTAENIEKPKVTKEK